MATVVEPVVEQQHRAVLERRSDRFERHLRRLVQVAIQMDQRHGTVGRRKLHRGRLLEASHVQLGRLEVTGGFDRPPLERTSDVVRLFEIAKRAAAGLGIAVLPEAAVQDLVRALGLKQIELTDEWVHRELLVGARDLAAMSRSVRGLFDHLLACGGASTESL